MIADLREAKEHDHARPPGATPVPDADVEILAGMAARCDTLYLICRTGKRSIIATQALTQQGIGNVVNVAGGMRAWIDNGLAVHGSRRPS